MKINFINRPALEHQTAQEQPSVWHVLRITVGVVCLFDLMGLVFFSTRPPPNWTAYQIYRIGYVAGVTGLWTVIAMSFKEMFPEALKVPPMAARKKWLTGLLILFFAALFLTHEIINAIQFHGHLMHLLETGRNRQIVYQTVVKAQKMMWRDQNLGTDLLGIVLSSTIILTAPFFEELFFRGYMLNRLCQSFHPFTAICVSAFWFACAHVFSKPIDALPRIFLLGFCCGLIRLNSGRWQDAMTLHFLNNLCVIWPLIEIAIVRFTLAP